MRNEFTKSRMHRTVLLKLSLFFEYLGIEQRASEQAIANGELRIIAEVLYLRVKPTNSGGA
jgi:hypothetical protein